MWTTPNASTSLICVLQLERMLNTSNQWQFDAFKLQEASNGHPLSALGYFLFNQAGLITKFNMKPILLARYAAKC